MSISTNHQSGVSTCLPFSSEPIFISSDAWIGFDLDGTLARTDNPGHFQPPYPLGEPRLDMLEAAKRLIKEGVTVKIFTARACEPAAIPVVQAWAEKHGLGPLEVTNKKDYALLRFYDDRAIPFPINNPGSGVSVSSPPRKSIRSAAADFDSTVKTHLAAYKREHLRIEENGLFKQMPYPHIIPKKHRELNILGPISDRFWRYQPTSGIRLHKYFHHLNSSQALCFNLFFPFLLEQKNQSLLLEILGIPAREEICDMAFEKIFSALDWHAGEEENTNFDFHIKFDSGHQIFVELKYSEREFAAAESNERRNRKLERIYFPRLQHCLKPGYCRSDFVLKNYQLCRNISYVAGASQDRLFLIFPKANTNLRETESFLNDAILEPIRSRIKVIHMEDMVSNLLGSTSANPLLKQHYEKFQLKYLPAAFSSDR